MSVQTLKVRTETFNAECGEHGGLCAFSAADPTRCPFCHASWAVIVRGGWHSCERRNVWPSRERGWRIAEAKRLRLAQSR